MGEWKAQLSLRVRQDLRREMEDYAYADRRKLGNVGETLLEWAWEQLRVAGSIERLLKFKITSGRKPNGSFEDKREFQNEDRGPGQLANTRRQGAPNVGEPVSEPPYLGTGKIGKGRQFREIVWTKDSDSEKRERQLPSSLNRRAKGAQMNQSNGEQLNQRWRVGCH